MRANQIENIMQDALLVEDPESSVIPCEQLFGFSLCCMVDDGGGAVAGTVYVEASIDGETWIPILDANQTLSAAGNVLFNISEVMYKYARVIWVDGGSGGDASMTVECFVKGV